MVKWISAKKIAATVTALAVAAQAFLPCGVCAKADTAATEFVFSDSGIAVSEGAYDGYEVEGTALTIEKSGVYQVSGTCADGTIKVKKGTDGVTLLLAGIDLAASDTAPLCCNKSSGVSILAKEGTVNRFADTSLNNDDNYPDNANAENAVIKCKDGSNVVIGGAGTVYIEANGKNGIKSGASTDSEGEASLTIEDVTLQIDAAVNDAVNAEALLYVKSGELSISAADDALHSDYELVIGEKGKGEGPKIEIASCYEGLEGANLTVYGGDIKIHSTDDGINAANSDLTGYAFTLEIAGGDVYVDAASGDGIDSNGTLTFSGGKTEVFSTSNRDNAPLDSDGTFRITGGTVFAVGNSGMAQSPVSGSQGYVAFGAAQFGGGSGGFPQNPGQGPGGRPQNPQGRPGEGNGATASSVSISAGDALTVTGSDNEIVYASEAVRSANYVLYSDGTLLAGQTYTLNTNGTAAATAAVVGGAVQEKPDDPQEPDPSDTPQDPAPAVTPDDPQKQPGGSQGDEVDEGTDLPSDEKENPDSDSTVREDISVASIVLGKARYTYDGREKKPSVAVRLGSRKLKKNTDYTVTYQNNRKVGVATVIVTGTGKYTGTVKKAFRIVPRGTSLTGKVKAGKKKFTVAWKKQAKSVTGYQIQYATNNKFTGKNTWIKTVSKSSVTKHTVRQLKAKKKYYVRIRTFQTVKGVKYCSDWSKTKSVKVK